MIRSISLSNYKAYGENQDLQFAWPTKESLGLTILVGPNNSGKSTPLNVIKAMVKNAPDVVLDGADLRRGTKPFFKLIIEHDNVIYSISTIGENESSYQKKRLELHGKEVPYSNAGLGRIRFIPARRPWNDQFQYNALSQYESYEMQVRESPDNQAAQLGQELRELVRSGKRQEFNLFVRSILPELAEWDLQHQNGQDYVIYVSRNGNRHRMNLLGEGFISVLRICYTLFQSEPNDTVILDEPELSLHPQAQRRLHRLIIKLSKDRQVILATHSPYLFSWRDLARGAKLFRFHQNAHGNTRAFSPKSETITRISGVADKDFRNRKLYDIVSKEIFFADQIVFLEGQEDLHLIENYIEEHDQEPLPLFGYGSGGAPHIENWLQLGSELGITSVGVYDANQRALADKSRELFASNKFVSILVLPRDDIRDKHLRDGKCKDTGHCEELNSDESRVVTGYFDRRGKPHEKSKAELDEFLTEIRNALEGVEKTEPRDPVTRNVIKFERESGSKKPPQN